MGESANFSPETLQEPFDGNSNSSSNSSNSSLLLCTAALRDPAGARVARAAIYAVALVVALIANSLVIAAFSRMREPLMLLIANMAASDLLTAIFLLPRWLTSEIVGSPNFQVHGLGGKILCKMCTFLSDISLGVSTVTLVIIAVERFLAVVHPLKVRQFQAIRRHLIISTWLVIMAIHTPYLYAMGLVKGENNVLLCKSTWILDNKPTFIRYNIFLIVTVFLIPLTAISVLYPIILINLRKDKMEGHRIVIKREKRRRKRNAKLVHLSAATVLLLLTCWSPYAVIFFLELISPDTLPKCSYAFNIVYFVAIILAGIYCALNPFICFLFLPSFRRELAGICKGKRRGSHVISRNKIGESRSLSCSRNTTDHSGSRRPAQHLKVGVNVLLESAV